ncbi:MAG TPA: Lrp/AsnC family transcriptional regulator [Burkholderiaceae bacterium]|nr:Lrp/AsnC family transcriptional regulator [Burkholderiaceae bacterium]
MAVLKLDKTDRKLLNLLQQNNLKTTRELAQLLHVSQPTLVRRLRELRSQGVVSADVSLVDPIGLGLGMYAFLDVSLHDQSEEAASQFEQRIQDEPEVLQCYFVTGAFDFFLILHVANIEAYYQFIRRVLSASGNVRHFESRFPLKRTKFTNRIAFDERVPQLEVRVPDPVAKPAAQTAPAASRTPRKRATR